VIGEYAEFHFFAWDDEREEVVGVGNAIPALSSAWLTRFATIGARRGVAQPG
jgi:hypothetical protein